MFGSGSVTNGRQLDRSPRGRSTQFVSIDGNLLSKRILTAHVSPRALPRLRVCNERGTRSVYRLSSWINKCFALPGNQASSRDESHSSMGDEGIVLPPCGCKILKIKPVAEEISRGVEFAKERVN